MKYTKEILQQAVSNSVSVAGVVKYLGLKLAGGTQSHISRLIDRFEIDRSHLLGKSHAKGMISSNRRSVESILVKRDAGFRQKTKLLVRAMIKSGVDHKCSKCNCPPEWLGNPLTLDVDHINEDWLDDRLENLRFLCPNCHSQFSRNLLPE